MDRQLLLIGDSVCIFRSSFAVVASVVMLITLTSLTHADNAAPSVGGGVGDTPVTRMEFMVVGRSLPPKLPDMPKPGADSLGSDIIFKMTDQASQDAVAKAVKLASDMSAQWPKCRFRVASIARVSGDISTPEPPSDTVVARVTMLGESGCLTTAK